MRFSTRWLPFVLQAALGVSVATFGTGCGALSALTNPKAAWAIQEPAPMSVIVRRAEVANGTAREVERLLGNTALDDESQWVPKTSLKKEAAQKLLKDLGSEPIYVGAKVRVVPAEVWLETFSTICSTEKQYPNLIASVSPELASSYEEVSTQAKEVADLKGQIAAEEKALDDKEEEPRKAEHEKAKAELEQKLDKANEAYKPKVEKFLSGVKEQAAKAGPDAKKRIGVAVVNLRRAVADAKISNAVALIRYPLAMPTMKDDVQTTAKRVVADVVEEKTGTRPDMANFKMDVKLEGTTPKFSLAGVTSAQLGSLSPEDVLAETTKRMKTYVTRVLTLVAYAGETQELLSFEGDVLDALHDGMALGGTDAGVEIGDEKVEVVAGAKPAIKRTGARTIAGLVPSACNKPAGKPVVAAAAAVEKVVPEKHVAEKPGKKPAKVHESNSATVMVKTVREAPVVHTAKPAAAVVVVKPAPAAKPESDGKCDVYVMKGDKKVCL